MAFPTITQARWTACGMGFDRPFKVEDHHRSVHGSKLPTDEVVEVEVEVSAGEDLLEALYNLNKHARRYADLAAENYQRDKGATAKANSIKKSALYDLKDVVLHRLHRECWVDRVERHVIDDRMYLFFVIGGWGFHLPADAWSGESLEVADTREVEGFKKGSKKERSDMSLKASLLLVQRELGLSANDHLEQRTVQYGAREYPIGWDYLDEDR